MEFPYQNRDCSKTCLCYFHIPTFASITTNHKRPHSTFIVKRERCLHCCTNAMFRRIFYITVNQREIFIFNFDFNQSEYSLIGNALSKGGIIPSMTKMIINFIPKASFLFFCSLHINYKQNMLHFGDLFVENM